MIPIFSTVVMEKTLFMIIIDIVGLGGTGKMPETTLLSSVKE